MVKIANELEIRHTEQQMMAISAIVKKAFRDGKRFWYVSLPSGFYHEENRKVNLYNYLIRNKIV